MKKTLLHEAQKYKQEYQNFKIEKLVTMSSPTKFWSTLKSMSTEKNSVPRDTAIPTDKL